VLDLTPNYEGVSAWFNNAATVAERLKVSADKEEGRFTDERKANKILRCIKRLSREGKYQHSSLLPFKSLGSL